LKLLADDNVPAPIVERLRDAGHDVWLVDERAREGPDDSILTLANRSRTILITSDKDFGELVFRRRLVHLGVILLRLAGLKMAKRASVTAHVVDEHGAELEGAFTVITPGAVRIRRRTC
jgi:predicted nuclease of predicted toxin-antitoxin system